MSRAARPSSRRVLRRAAFGGPLNVVVSVVLMVLAVCVVGAGWVAPHSPSKIDPRNQLKPPSSAHLFGTDELGRDLLSRLIHGSRTSIIVAVSSVALAALIGVVLGGLCAVRGRWMQGAVLRLADVLLAFPEVLLAIAVMAVLGASTLNLVLSIAFAYVPRFIRLSWSALLVVREQPYVEAAYAGGSTKTMVLLRHLLPNIGPVLAVQFTLSLGHAILIESALSYIGLGAQPPAPSWGGMISSAQLYLHQSIYPVLLSGAAISLTVLAFNFFGDALAEVLDPRLATPAGSRRDDEDGVDG